MDFYIKTLLKRKFSELSAWHICSYVILIVVSLLIKLSFLYIRLFYCLCSKKNLCLKLWKIYYYKILKTKFFKYNNLIIWWPSPFQRDAARFMIIFSLMYRLWFHALIEGSLISIQCDYKVLLYTAVPESLILRD